VTNRTRVSLAILFGALPAFVTAQSMPADSVVRDIIRMRVDSGRYAGVAVGLVSRDGRQQVTVYGPRAGVTPFDGNTVFEIGSITKTFTAAILADMVAKKELALDDPVAHIIELGHSNKLTAIGFTVMLIGALVGAIGSAIGLRRLLEV